MKSRYGEIAHVQDAEFNYVITMFKQATPFPEMPPFAPWPCIKITARTAKSRQFKAWMINDKETRAFRLLQQTWNLTVMRELIRVIKEYLDYWKPEYLQIGAYDDYHDRRISFYTKQLNRLGYFLYKEKDEVLYFKRKGG